MLSLRLLVRNLRSAEVRILGLATLMAVALVSSIALFADRLERGMEAQSHAFIASDRVVRSNRQIPESWIAQAQGASLRTATTTVFSSMVFHGDSSHLASVKAVGEGYPLIGVLETSDQPFGDGEVREHRMGPAPGEVWVEGRLFPILQLNVGDHLEVGETQLRISQVLVSEPDRGQGFMNFGARVLMHAQDLPSTGVLQEGSRASFNLLLAGEEESIDTVLANLQPGLSVHERVIDVAKAQSRIARNLKTARNFLMLASVFGVLLAGIAIAMAAQRFCSRHVDQVALLKSLGVVSSRIRQLYLGQMLWLGAIAGGIGLALGFLLQMVIAESLSSLLTVNLPAPGLIPSLLGLMAGFLCLLFFALPPLWPLPKVAPIKVLRRETPVASTAGSIQLIVGFLSSFCLLWLYTGELAMSGAVMAAWAGVALVATGLAILFLRLLGRHAAQLGSQWRLAIASLKRRRAETHLQVVVFGTALMLLATLLLVRGSLLEEWRLQLPADAPNHFVVNLSPAELPEFEGLLAERALSHSGLYPLVRGRLTHINGEDAKARALAKAEAEAEAEQAAGERGPSEAPEAMTRELNLSWTSEVPEGNSITDGVWWAADSREVEVSVEQEFAKWRDIALGDELTFSIGGLSLKARVTSFRSLRWDSLRPNFFVLFSPGALDDYAPMYMTSLYAPADGGRFVADLVRRHPTALVIEMEKIFTQIRSVIDQVSGSVQLVFWLVFLASMLVLMASVHASMDARTQEVGLLRALGSSRRLLRHRLWIEFAALGALSGLVAALGAESLLWGLQRFVFDLTWQPHPWIWLSTPVFGAVVIGAFGAWSCRHLLSLPPATVLRQAA
ncbi:ABC transporter permease [Simiduia aestuariiviva]|uniref:Putative ABC transport system permease protein n=1 Tax=Simiduia aestuariiviva TaxID=1510459 RepID=A0A839UNY6_9GAMM|nr:FtsX-like permease family protein [Simiduia aestuariiviva]MBB3168250.1 putative ABC transport system permease protein [Simiduia aestuariiviva]